MNKTELQDLMDQFVDALPDDRDIEWFSTDRSVGTTVLNAFLWWLHPELRPKDLPPWSLWPLREDDEVVEPPSFAWLAGHTTVGEYQEGKRQQNMQRNFQRLYGKEPTVAPGTDPIFIRMYEWRCDDHLHVQVTGRPELIVEGDQSWFTLAVTIGGYNWVVVYNENTLQWESADT